MKLPRRRWVIGVLVVVALIGAGWIFFGHNDEPRYQGKTVSYWFKRYYLSQHYGVLYEDGHDDAMDPLRAMGTNVLPYLVRIAFSTNEDSPARTNFYNLLAKLPDSWHLPHLIPRDEIRQEAMYAIRDIGPSASHILPLIQTELNQNNTRQHTQALYMLGFVTNELELIVPYFAKAAHDTNSDLQEPCLFALAQLGPKASPAQPDLMAIFQDTTSTERVRRGAAWALASIGSNAAPAIPMLKDAFEKETGWRLRCFLASCLYKIDPGQAYAFDFLINTLTNDAKSEQIQVVANRLLYIGPSAKVSIPALLNTLKTTNCDLYATSSVLFSLQTLGASNDQVLPVLEQKLDSASDDMRDLVANRILNIDPTNHEAELTLIDLIKRNAKSADDDINRLRKMGPAAREAIPVLQEALNSTNITIRFDAQFALEAIRANASGK